MPELPEVETLRRGILAAVGSTIRDAVRLRCRYRPIGFGPSAATIRKRCAGRRILEITRLGKRVVVHVAGEHYLIFESRMTGLLLTADPPDTEHLRFRLDLLDGPWPHIWYWDRRGLGSVRCYNAVEFTKHLGPQRLGPDALSLAADELHSRLITTRRPIKVALLDQKLLAGIGNLYAAEILHMAGIHPARPSASLTRKQSQRLHAALQHVLQEAIRYEGSTLGDGTYRNALSHPGEYQNHHRVYAREDEFCLTCRRTQIVRIVQGQRSTFYCPRCQKL